MDKLFQQSLVDLVVRLVKPVNNPFLKALLFVLILVSLRAGGLI